MIESYEEYSDQAAAQLEEARKKLSEIQEKIESGIDEGIDTANAGIDQAANFSLWGFCGLLASAILSILGALLGVKIASKQEARRQ
ncbi:MAG: hypothetical protein Q4P72_06060 [Eubacteriales bacterium]|nr:hypothetical protein [Eubacteriales bacterium]